MNVRLRLARSSKRFASSNGFILPVVLILAVSLSIVGITALTTVGNSSVTLNDQYYQQLAEEAAQAGARAAQACISAGTTTWSTPLAPNTDCTGTTGAGLAYVSTGDNWTTTYSVATPSGTSPIIITSTGKTLLKSSSGATLKTYTSTSKGRFGQTTTSTPAKRVTKVAVSWYLSCGIGSLQGMSNPAGYCWGDKSCNGTGDGSYMSCNGTIFGPLAPYPVAVDASATSVLNGKTVTDIAVGNYHMIYGFACAVAYSGTDTTTSQPYCWGTPLNGNLVASAPHLVSGFSGKTVTKITTGDLHACAIAYTTSIGPSDSHVYCWGVRQFGALGIGGSGANWVTTPTLVNGGDLGTKTVVDVSAGYRYTCAVAYTTSASIDAKPYCWGDNTSGNLGTGNITSQTVPKAVVTTGALSGKTVSNISSGSLYMANTCTSTNADGSCASTDDVAQTHTCAMAYPSGGSTANTAVYCWGDNLYDELGTNSTTPYTSNSPTTVFTGSGSDLQNRTVTALATGGYNTCTLSYPTGGSTAQVKASCWGSRACGALGDGQQGGTSVCAPNNNSTKPVAVSTTSPSALVGKVPTSISAGIYQGCVTAYDGVDINTEHAYCWGGNDWGNLGNGTSCPNCWTGNKYPIAVDTSSSSALGSTSTTTSVLPIFY